MGEQGLPLAEICKVTGSLVARVVTVDGRHRSVRVGDRILQSTNAGKVDLDSRADNKLFVADVDTVAKRKGVLIRREGLDLIVVKSDFRINHIGQSLFQRIFILKTSSDQSPAGLVMVPFRWVDKSNVLGREAS